MHKCYLLILLFLVFIACKVFSQRNNSSFELTGKVLNQDTGTISLNYINRFKQVIRDTAKITNGSFYFSGNIIEPTSGWIKGNIKSSSVDDPNIATIFLEPARMHLILKKDDFKNLNVQGSKSHSEFESLNQNQKLLLDNQDIVYKQILKVSDSLERDSTDLSLVKILDSLNERLTYYKDRRKDIDLKFIAANPNSYVSAYTLQYYIARISIDSSKLLFSKLSALVQSSRMGGYIKQMIKIEEAGLVGNKATNFKTVDVNGLRIDLSLFKSYILLDFWGSWCIPCRKANPHLIEIYNKYHSKGLDIISVAHDDNNENEWRHAIKQDRIDAWHHVLQGFDFDRFSRGESNERDIGEKYGIDVYPTKILIDKQGFIIGRYEGDDSTALDKKLSEIFNQNQLLLP